MKKDVKKMIEEGFELSKKHEQIRQEILNYDSLPKEMKEELIKLKEKLDQQHLKDEKYIKDNQHRKIVGYNTDDFMPIYEDEQ